MIPTIHRCSRNAMHVITTFSFTLHRPEAGTQCSSPRSVGVTRLKRDTPGSVAVPERRMRVNSCREVSERATLFGAGAAKNWTRRIGSTKKENG